MRLASVMTPNGKRVVAQVGEFYIDLNATDPGLPTCMKQMLGASKGVKKAGRATKRTVKRGTHKVAKATEKGANKVADKTHQ